MRIFQEGGLTFAESDNELSYVKICLHGAHVMSFVPKNGGEVLFMSSRRILAEGTAIRGGIPVCWPYFGANKEDKTLPAHGPARISQWVLTGAEKLPGGAEKFTFEFSCNQLAVRYAVTAGRTLDLELTTVNNSGEQRRVEEALHSYFAVGDIAQTEVRGLDGALYDDKLSGETVRQQGGIFFDAETDRIYRSAASCHILDGAGKRRITVEKWNSRSTVVWNPWVRKSLTFRDFAPEEYKRMVCVESGNIGENAVLLSPGESSSMKVRIFAETPEKTE